MAPICNWVQTVDFGDFCAGWGIRFRDIDPLPDEEQGEIKAQNDNSGAGLQGSPKPTPKATSKRIGSVRPGMTSLNPSTPEERATWRYLGPKLTCAHVRLTDPEWMPRAPKSPSYLWNESGPALPNDEEKLFLAFLVVGNSWSVEEQLIWASAALGEELNVTRLGSAWKPPDSNGWRAPSKVVPAPLFAPLFAAYKRPWEAPEMERIAVAMEQWPLAGRIVGLNRHHLTAHKKRNHGKGPFGPALPGAGLQATAP